MIDAEGDAEGSAMVPSWARWLGSMSVLGSVALTVGLVVLIRGPGEHAASVVPGGSAPRAILRSPDGPVFSVAWSPDGRALAASGWGPTVRIWEPGSGRGRSVSWGEAGAIFAMGWSPDGRSLAVADPSGRVDFRDVEPNPARMPGSAILPEGGGRGIRPLAAACRGGPIRLWGPDDARSRLIPGMGEDFHVMAITPDGRTVASGGKDGTIRIGDVATGEVRRTLRGDHRGVNSLAFSADGTTLASGGGGPLLLWDVVTGRELARFGSERGFHGAVAIAPDGARVAGVSWDGSVRIWEISTGREVARFLGHEGLVLSIAWSPDGSTLASAGYDATVRLWVPPGSPRAGLASR